MRCELRSGLFWANGAPQREKFPSGYRIDIGQGIPALGSSLGNTRANGVRKALPQAVVYWNMEAADASDNREAHNLSGRGP